jgi:hypothetical protein
MTHWDDPCRSDLPPNYTLIISVTYSEWVVFGGRVINLLAHSYLLTSLFCFLGFFFSYVMKQLQTSMHGVLAIGVVVLIFILLLLLLLLLLLCNINPLLGNYREKYNYITAATK